jgi:hypothetical protein
VRYKHGFYIPEDDILHSDRRENLKSYIALTGWAVRPALKADSLTVIYELIFEKKYGHFRRQNPIMPY